MLVVRYCSVLPWCSMALSLCRVVLTVRCVCCGVVLCPVVLGCVLKRGIRLCLVVSCGVVSCHAVLSVAAWQFVAWCSIMRCCVALFRCSFWRIVSRWRFCCFESCPVVPWCCVVGMLVVHHCCVVRCRRVVVCCVVLHGSFVMLWRCACCGVVLHRVVLYGCLLCFGVACLWGSFVSCLVAVCCLAACCFGGVLVWRVPVSLSVSTTPRGAVHLGFLRGQGIM